MPYVPFIYFLNCTWEKFIDPGRVWIPRTSNPVAKFNKHGTTVVDEGRGALGQGLVGNIYLFI